MKCVKVVNIRGTQMIITGSWDSTIKYWDMRQPRPVYSVDIPDKCYSMDAKESLMVAATARQDICIFDLRNPTNISKVTITIRYYSSNNIDYKEEGKMKYSYIIIIRMFILYSSLIIIYT